jgi:hypothetical protein
MKKVILVLLAGFIVLIFLLPVLSDASIKNGEVLKASTLKKYNQFDMKFEDNIIIIKSREGKKIDKIAVITEWPWIPVMQFEKYRKYFISGVSIDSNK